MSFITKTPRAKTKLEIIQLVLFLMLNDAFISLTRRMEFFLLLTSMYIFWINYQVQRVLYNGHRVR